MPISPLNPHRPQTYDGFCSSSPFIHMIMNKICSAVCSGVRIGYNSCCGTKEWQILAEPRQGRKAATVREFLWVFRRATSVLERHPFPTVTTPLRSFVQLRRPKPVREQFLRAGEPLIPIEIEEQHLAVWCKLEENLPTTPTRARNGVGGRYDSYCHDLTLTGRIGTIERDALCAHHQ
jgi:hypothetical protein